MNKALWAAIFGLLLIKYLLFIPLYQFSSHILIAGTDGPGGMIGIMITLSFLTFMIHYLFLAFATYLILIKISPFLLIKTTFFCILIVLFHMVYFYITAHEDYQKASTLEGFYTGSFWAILVYLLASQWYLWRNKICYFYPLGFIVVGATIDITGQMLLVTIYKITSNRTLFYLSNNIAHLMILAYCLYFVIKVYRASGKSTK